MSKKKASRNAAKKDQFAVAAEIVIKLNDLGLERIGEGMACFDSTGQGVVVRWGDLVLYDGYNYAHVEDNDLGDDGHELTFETCWKVLHCHVKRFATLIGGKPPEEAEPPKPEFYFRIDYYRNNGRLYTSEIVNWDIASVAMGEAYILDAVHKLRVLREKGECPGLTNGWKHTIVICQCDLAGEKLIGTPHLLLPEQPVTTGG